MPALAYRTSLPRPDDPEIIALVCEATRKGHPIETAGRMAGLGYTVAGDWVHKGKQLMEAAPGIAPEELGSHAVFSMAVKGAEAELVDKRLDRIDEAGHKGFWQADMTLLERRMPHEFGRFSRSEVRVEQRTISINIEAQLAPVAREALLEMVRAELEAGQPLALPEAQTST